VSKNNDDYMTWVEHLEKHGWDETKELVRAAVVAETFLLHATLATDIDYCIDVLKRVKRKRGEVRTVLDILLESRDAEAESPCPAPVPHNRRKRAKSGDNG
jgi:hypothetical protein